MTRWTATRQTLCQHQTKSSQTKTCNIHFLHRPVNCACRLDARTVPPTPLHHHHSSLIHHRHHVSCIDIDGRHEIDLIDLTDLICGSIRRGRRGDAAAAGGQYPNGSRAATLRIREPPHSAGRRANSICRKRSLQ